MGTFLDIITILGLMAWLMKLATGGIISIELAGGAMVALVAFVAIARAFGSGLIKLAFRVALPIAGLAVLIAWESGGNARAMQELATAIEARDKRRYPAAESVRSESRDSVVARLRQRDALSQEGLITNTEYQQKREILRDL